MVTLQELDFGVFNNTPVKQFTWETDKGFSFSVISFGAIIQSILVPDLNGITCDITLGFDDIDGYVNRNDPHFGGTVGRCANRIGGASFEIDDVKYNLAKNVGENHLHGGITGFDRVNWESTVDGNRVIFSYLSKDGEEGYPGNLVTNVIYEVINGDTLSVQYKATTTKKTVINLTNHAYFNLAGHGAGSEELYNHVVTINSDKITETDEESIPTGHFIPVGGTPFDLRVPRRLGDVMKNGFVYDDNYCVSVFDNEGLHFVSRVEHPGSGRYFELYNNKPGVQFYTSNFLPRPEEPALIGKDGVRYERHGAFCLETQDFPDSIHHSNFPSVVLKPGDVYDHRFLYKFGSIQ